VVDSTFLLGEGGALGIFMVGRGATSADSRGDGVFVVIMFEDLVEG